jgi:hypothetical protein
MLGGVVLRLICGVAISSLLALLQASQPTAVIAGTVTLENGLPANGAVILFQRLDGKGRKETKADKAGHYVAHGLPVGTYNVFAAVIGLVDRVEGYRVSISGSGPLNFKLAPPPPTQPPVVAGCVAAREIRETQGGSYISSENAPQLEAVVANECPYLASIWVTLAYYDASGVQIDTQLEHATVAAGTKWSLVHILNCAKYLVDCTPQQWRARIRVIEVRAYRQ